MPTIEFTCFNENTVRDFKPVLAKTVQPDWWKTLKIAELSRFEKMHTIRACPAMQDWLTMGWYLIAKRDIQVIQGSDKSYTDDERVSAYDPGVRKEKGQYHSQSHPRAQFGEVFNFLGEGQGPIRDAFKMRNPWNVKTPKGYSCFYLDPFLHQSPYFSTWPGIIDTDTFNKNMDNAQIIFYPKVDHSFVIKSGTPLVQIIPFRREEWTASYQLREVKEAFENLSADDEAETTEKSVGLYKRLYPEDNMFSAGPYRKFGYWKEKSKYYKEDGPPPECPFHNKDDDSPETQLELDV